MERGTGRVGTTRETGSLRPATAPKPRFRQHPLAWFATPSGKRDVALFGLAYLAYSLSRWISIPSRSTAVSHAHSVAHLERWLHVGVETQAQRVFDVAPFPQLFDYLYLAAQVFVIPLTLWWVYRRGPEKVYRLLRNTVLCTWALALPVYALYPTAPPRLSGMGVVDTVSQSSVIPLNAHLTTALFNPYAAVPSLHAGLAVVVSVALVAALRSRWSRALGALWGPAICLAVVATGNHFVFDIATGLVCAALGYALALTLPTLAGALRAAGIWVEAAVTAPLPVKPAWLERLEAPHRASHGS